MGCVTVPTWIWIGTRTETRMGMSPSASVCFCWKVQEARGTSKGHALLPIETRAIWGVRQEDVFSRWPPNSQGGFGNNHQPQYGRHQGQKTGYNSKDKVVSKAPTARTTETNNNSLPKYCLSQYTSQSDCMPRNSANAISGKSSGAVTILSTQLEVGDKRWVDLGYNNGVQNSFCKHPHSDASPTP